MAPRNRKQRQVACLHVNLPSSAALSTETLCRNVALSPVASVRFSTSLPPLSASCPRLLAEKRP